MLISAVGTTVLLFQPVAIKNTYINTKKLKLQIHESFKAHTVTYQGHKRGAGKGWVGRGTWTYLSKKSLPEVFIKGILAIL